MIYRAYADICKIIKELCDAKEHVIIAIDGRCAAGKTTFAGRLHSQYGGNVIHMDHFFLRPGQRTAERLLTPGENIDRERFLDEVLKPLKAGKKFSYRPFDCRSQELAAPIYVPGQKLNIVEGSYSCHPSLWDWYDYRIFLTVGLDLQLKRISARNGIEQTAVFANKWIPLEEKYFSAYKIAERCDSNFCGDIDLL